jgi:hypothetical protein
MDLTKIQRIVVLEIVNIKDDPQKVKPKKKAPRNWSLFNIIIVRFLGAYFKI